jgi:hypothetical protein
MAMTFTEVWSAVRPKAADDGDRSALARATIVVLAAALVC